MRTLLLGLDGLDPYLVEEFYLPNIESIGEGYEIDTHGNSGPSWVSVMTGLVPDQHGVYKLEPQQDQQSWEGKPIWEKIRGYSGIANVPLTYPPKEIRGWMVTGVMTPNKAIYTHPPDLYKELDGLGYKVDMWVEEHENHPHGHFGTVPFNFDSKFTEDKLNILEDVIKTRGDVFTYLIKEHPVDFCFLCFTSLDRVQHLAFHREDVVEHFYKLMDEQVGKVLENVGNIDIFAVSDHGFREVDIPDTDIRGEHRKEGFGATNTDRKFRNLEQLHDNIIEEARSNNTEGRLRDLGYL